MDLSKHGAEAARINPERSMNMDCCLLYFLLPLLFPSPSFSSLAQSHL